MKILRILSSGYEQGGAENGIVLMQSILKERGHEVKIMASNLRMDLPRIDDFTFTATTKNRVAGVFYRLFNPHSYFLLRKVLKEYKPDIVHIHTMGEVSPSVLFLLRRIPTVFTVHGPEEFIPSLMMWCLPQSDFVDQSYKKDQLTLVGKFRYFYYRFLSTPVYRLGLRNVDVVITLSNFMSKLLATDGIKNKYVPNGTVLFKDCPLPDNKTLAYVGRLEKFKGVDVLIRAMPKIINNFPDARLHIAGTGNYEKELQGIVNELGIQNQVQFLGHLTRVEVEEVYASSVALVLPSTLPEAFGKVGIEAMSIGRPVIASDIGGIGDWLINGKTGFLISPNDEQEIVDKASILFSDRQRLLEMSKMAKARAEDFSLERHANEMINLYNEVLKKYKN